MELPQTALNMVFENSHSQNKLLSTSQGLRTPKDKYKQMESVWNCREQTNTSVGTVPGWNQSSTLPWDVLRTESKIDSEHMKKIGYKGTCFAMENFNIKMYIYLFKKGLFCFSVHCETFYIFWYKNPDLTSWRKQPHLSKQWIFSYLQISLFLIFDQKHYLGAEWRPWDYTT